MIKRRKVPAVVPTKLEFLNDLAGSKRNSVYRLSGGSISEEYIDLDAFCLGAKGDRDYDRERAERRLLGFKEHALPVLLAAVEKHSIGRLAFVEKRDAGPVGMLTLMHFILMETQLNGCVVRTDRRLFAARIKGSPIVPGERILVVSDVATTGATVAMPANALRQLGAVVPAAFVLYDRQQGAPERLKVDGIDLVSYAQDLGSGLH